MCKWGTNVELRVPIPANLSHTGKERWAMKAIDACIAPIVDTLNKGGILTESSCCGHGKMDGNIYLQDGRVLIIHASDGGLWHLRDKFAFRKPLENRNQLVKDKVNLFHTLISFKHELLTDLEVDIGYLLAGDPDIQRRLEGHYPEFFQKDGV